MSYIDRFKTSNIFKKEYIFDENYTSDRIPFREKELSLLSQLFLSLITNPNEISQKVLITGKPHTGKTTSIRFFAETLIAAAKKRNVDIKYVYIDCNDHNTIDKVLSEIRNRLKPKDEKQYFRMNKINLNHRHKYPTPSPHILLVLDDLDFLDDDTEVLLKLIRDEYEDSATNAKEISIISIASNLDFLKSRMGDNVENLRRNLIVFKPFSREQIYDILNYRASLGMYFDAYTSEIIEIITELTFQSGNYRDGLKLLWEAGKIAEEKNLRQITPECVRLGREKILRK
jgi:cell division control protein 6